MQNNITVPAASKRRVVDAFTRALHALMAVSFGLAYITSELEGLRLVHVTMGYTLGAVFLIRVMWGVVGPRRVRLKGLTGRLGTLDHTLEMIKGFDWQGLVKLLLAVSMVTLLVCSMPVVASGYVTYLDWLGKWTKEVHETLSNVMLLAVGCHVGAVTLLSMGKTDRQVRPMITGCVAGNGPDLVKHNLVAVALALLLVVVSFWSWQTYQYLHDPQFTHQPQWLHPLGGYIESDDV